ncbi:MAG: hypothetical protein QOD99_1267 [Chthoniobacter sp.]|nr:hypothetical protein [Chthoniobacter sp.]
MCTDGMDVPGFPCKVAVFHFASVPTQLHDRLGTGAFFERPLL